ncbi:MAG: hypothetical protein JWN64_267 [Parcubacteria group bacterium]|nr:hypothetical protein [Parcubacteria group bacterium]
MPKDTSLLTRVRPQTYYQRKREIRWGADIDAEFPSPSAIAKLLPSLSKAERDVVKLMAEGKPFFRIGVLLDRGEAYVVSVSSSALEKLGLPRTFNELKRERRACRAYIIAEALKI